ncbi:hypothetical protein [Proteiniborus sp.]|uniref:hypothetical protein n=1 Tax=Proteiniborus sp. TaxID=2079015 RepID=UPI003318B4FF
MKKTNLFNKKAIIIFPIILALLLTSFGTMSLFDKRSNNEAQDSQQYIENIEELVDDETALKIIDIHKYPNTYKDKIETFDAQFFEFEDGHSVGIEYFFESGDSLLFDIPADFSNVDLPQGIESFDWIKVTGKIGIIEDLHDEHSHHLPIIYVTSIDFAE